MTNTQNTAPMPTIDIGNERDDKPSPTKQEDTKTDTASLSADAPKIKCVPIIGQVEGHYILGEGQKTTKYEQLIPLFAEAEEDDSLGGLLIILNTVGGDVEAGLALSELIASMKKPTVSLVLGGGHSIGVPLAVSARRSFIVPTATMTVHPVRINGLVLGAPQSFDYLTRMQNRIIDFITSHSRCEADAVRRLMLNTDEIATDMGSVLEGKDAVEVGLIDELGGMSRAMECLRDMMEVKREE